MTQPTVSILDSYEPILDVRETETAIKLIKDHFEASLAEALNLKRVTAPLCVAAGSGINDDLNGVERPVAFPVRDLDGAVVEVVQSLAKWKRLALADLGFGVGEGIYTDMNAIRPDESLDHLHSIYVDQWDWERIIREEDRTVAFLQRVVRKIYRALRRTERFLFECFPELRPVLPDKLTFIHSEELARAFPDVSPQEREDRIAAARGAVFIVGIGAPLSDGRPHDGRAPDYDDWITPNGEGQGLNGDLIVWHAALGQAVELSSMGIRVTPESLLAQLEARGCPERRELYFHRRLLAGELPPSIGGGIGQSRLCQVLLRKVHIGEVQAGLWPETMRKKCAARGVPLL